MTFCFFKQNKKIDGAACKKKKKSNGNSDSCNSSVVWFEGIELRGILAQWGCNIDVNGLLTTQHPQFSSINIFLFLSDGDNATWEEKIKIAAKIKKGGN